MRKVTASAVILTALTGCSQSSGVPSSQWSFELPSKGTADTAQSIAATDQEAADKALSTDAQSSLGGTYAKSMMGPAFEQPTESGTLSSTPVGASVSSVGRPGSREISTMAPGQDKFGTGSGSVTSSRPDPVDQVRSYLRSSGRPSALSNRQPYASQVYLSTPPTPAADGLDFPISVSPTAVPSEDAFSANADLLTAGLIGTAAPANSVTAGLPASNSAISSFSAPAFNSSADLSFIESQAAYGNPLPPAPVAFSTGLSEDSFLEETPIQDATASVPVASNQVMASAQPTPDGLPQLASAQLPGTQASSWPSTQPNDLSFLSAAPQAAEPAPAEDISIGTAILRDLQGSDDAQPAETASFETANVETDASAQLASDTNAETYSAQTLSFVLDNTEHQPTLVSLSRTMPARELSPIVASRRSALSADYGFSAPEMSSPSMSSTETSNDSFNNSAEASEHPAIAPEPSAIEADLHSSSLDSSSDDYSPLLESFNAVETAPTIYVPIGREVSSGNLIQDAVSALGEEASTASFLNDIAVQNAFSSVLTSPALLSTEASRENTILARVSSTANQPVQSSGLTSDITANDISTKSHAQRSGQRYQKLSKKTSIGTLLNTINREAAERRQLITWQ